MTTPIAREELERVARRWIDGLNQNDERILDHLVAEDVVDHSGMARLYGPGREGIKRLVAQLRFMVPDWRSTIDEISVNGDLVTIRHTGSGRAPGAFRGLGPPALGPMMQLQMVSTIRVVNGRIVEHWAKSAPDVQGRGAT